MFNKKKQRFIFRDRDVNDCKKWTGGESFTWFMNYVS